jgi:hypothetical protein
LRTISIPKPDGPLYSCTDDVRCRFAFTLAIVVFGDDDDLAAGKDLQSFGYRMGHGALA